MLSNNTYFAGVSQMRRIQNISKYFIVCAVGKIVLTALLAYPPLVTLGEKSLF